MRDHSRVVTIFLSSCGLSSCCFKVVINSFAVKVARIWLRIPRWIPQELTVLLLLLSVFKVQWIQILFLSPRAQLYVFPETNLSIKKNHGCFSFHRLHDSNAPGLFFPCQFLHPNRHREHNPTAINCLQLKHNSRNYANVFSFFEGLVYYLLKFYSQALSSF